MCSRDINQTTHRIQTGYLCEFRKKASGTRNVISYSKKCIVYQVENVGKYYVFMKHRCPGSNKIIHHKIILTLVIRTGFFKFSYGVFLSSSLFFPKIQEQNILPVVEINERKIMVLKKLH